MGGIARGSQLERIRVWLVRRASGWSVSATKGRGVDRAGKRHADWQAKRAAQLGLIHIACAVRGQLMAMWSEA